MKKVSNGDIGGGGSKIWHFYGDVIFEWPLKEFSLMLFLFVLHSFDEQSYVDALPLYSCESKCRSYCTHSNIYLDLSW